VNTPTLGRFCTARLGRADIDVASLAVDLLYDIRIFRCLRFYFLIKVAVAVATITTTIIRKAKLKQTLTERSKRSSRARQLCSRGFQDDPKEYLIFLLWQDG
jgi:hypothetical protein